MRFVAIVEQGIYQRQAAIQPLLLLIGALLLTVVIQYGANWVRRRMTNRVIGELVARMRKEALGAAVERDMAFYDENKTGKVLSRITSDTEDFGQVMLVGSDIVSQLLQMGVLVAVLLTRNVRLTVIALLFMIPMMFAAVWFRSLARKVTRQGSRAMAIVNDNIQDI